MKNFISIMLLPFLFLLGCQKTVVSPSENAPDPQALCGTCGPGTFKCEIKCAYGGFKIKVYEWPGGGIKYSYQAMNTIYVDQAYHDANYPFSSTNNPYTFDSFILLSTNNSPSSPWKDTDGNVIVGNVYQYRLKTPQCLANFSTAMLHGVPDPCDMNNALLHINQSANKPGANCGNPNIICPAPPINSIPFIAQKPQSYWPAFNIHYSYDCIDTLDGVCVEDAFPDEDEIHNPKIGPISFEYLPEQNALKANLWRDPGVSELIFTGANTVIDERIMFRYQFEPGTQIIAGSYPVLENEFEHGYVMLPLTQ